MPEDFIVTLSLSHGRVEKETMMIVSLDLFAALLFFFFFFFWMIVFIVPQKKKQLSFEGQLCILWRSSDHHQGYVYQVDTTLNDFLQGNGKRKTKIQLRNHRLNTF